ncbi:hypothetical protein BGZ79_002778 [Entomortierella chlamydospora]|nr:hypothetical protein BGZ79_002778 [Entomortierella chlamydospora]
MIHMVANFRKCPSGHYRIIWRIKLHEDFAVSEGLRFNANVSYEAELNTEVSLDVFMRLPKLEKLGSAHVKVVLCNMENVEKTPGVISGIAIERVEIKPLSSTETPNALSHEKAYITVWSMEADVGSDRCAVAEIPVEPGISVGLAISANGDQVAVYQEPKVGEWGEDTDIIVARKFPFRLFSNPLISQVLKDTSTIVAFDDSKKPELGEVEVVPNTLKGFTGYGKFLLGASGDHADGDSGNGNVGHAQQPKSIFVACNGLYLDVFEASSEKWQHMHSISLVKLNPTVSRRITCKMMMESISSNTFMWLEEDGTCCTVWNLQKGYNISYISPGENSAIGSEARYCKMAMSPTGSIVALATTNGTLITYFANSGAPIDYRMFPGYKIEHIGFHGQDNRLFVVLRGSRSPELKPRILDSLQLKSEIAVNSVPIPTIDSAILAFFNTDGFKGKGVVCEAFGREINLYISHQPSSSKAGKGNDKTADVKFNRVAAKPERNEQYELDVKYHREHLPEGLHERYWVHSVDVIKKNNSTGNNKVIFSFVPEPWMRIITTKAANPLGLMSAYFLPDETRFAVVGMQTIQIWVLPTTENPKCSLQFIWGKPKFEESRAPNSKRCPAEIEREIKNQERVENHYYEIVSAVICMNMESGNTVAHIKIDDGEDKDMGVSIPGPEYSDPESRTTVGTIGLRYAIEPCFDSIHLLAAIYAFCKFESNKAAKLGAQSTLTLNDHSEAIIRFTRGHLNRKGSIPRSGPSQYEPQGDSNQKNFIRKIMSKIPGLSIDESPIAAASKPHKETTLLMSLLDQTSLQKANLVFVKGLLAAEGGPWIPSDDEDLNPIKRAIEIGNRPLIEAFIEYGVKYAKSRHPAYLTPVVQCMEELSRHYPDLVGYMFKMTAYVPAHNHGYLMSHINVAGPQLWVRFKRFLRSKIQGNSSRSLDDYENPVFSLRSQLPLITTDLAKARIIRFPKEDEEAKKKKLTYTHKVYVCPYPGLSKHGPGKSWRNGFTMIAGKDYFDNEALQATLRYKWQEYAFYYWLIRFFFVFVFAILVITFTAAQVTVSKIPVNANATTIDWSEYVDDRSPYNYMDVTTIVINVVGCASLLTKKPTGKPDDEGPDQIPALSFAILAIYVNMLLELRIFKPLGIVVNIILNIGRKVFWFLIILTLFLISFTLSLQHLLHTRRYHMACIKGNTKDCPLQDYPGGYPANFFGALTDTYFFLAGRYDPVSNSLDSGTTSFRIMMLMFFMFTAILLLNILIALMNDGFNLSQKQGEVAWHKQLSEVIAEVERFLMTRWTHKNNGYFPDYIYYYASEREAETFESGHRISSKSKLSPEKQFLMNVYDKITAVQQTQGQKLEEVLKELGRCPSARSNPNIDDTPTETSKFGYDTEQQSHIEISEDDRDKPGGSNTTARTGGKQGMYDKVFAIEDAPTDDDNS